MPIITSESSYRAALDEITTLMRAERNTPDGARLDALVASIAVFEKPLHDAFLKSDHAETEAPT
ncbi:MAG: hypothetical protein QM686_17500 [Herbaspirillum sp.]